MHRPCWRDRPASPDGADSAASDPSDQAIIASSKHIKPGIYSSPSPLWGATSAMPKPSGIFHEPVKQGHRPAAPTGETRAMRSRDRH